LSSGHVISEWCYIHYLFDKQKNSINFSFLLCKQIMNKSLRFYLPALLALLMTFSCGDAKETAADAGALHDSVAAPYSHSYYLKTFEVTDSSGIAQGWGYDIYVDSTRTIHQPNIPAVSGISAFKTEEDANRTGNYAIGKMIKSGSFPTLSIPELDSLGVLK